jgi:hypothetical protein
MITSETCEPKKQDKHHNIYNGIEDLEGVLKRLMQLRLEIVGESGEDSTEQPIAPRSLSHVLDYAPRRIGELVKVIESEIEFIRENIF